MNKLLGILATAAVFALVGCGGGGTGISSGSGRVNTYLSDSMDGNDHVWVTVYRVDLRTSADVLHNVYDDSAGRVIDVRSLRDLSGARFAFLGNETAPSGSYAGAIVTLGRSLTVFPAGASSGVTKTFAPAYNDPSDSSRSRIDFGFAGARSILAGSNDLIIDFDLPSWDDSGGLVTPVLQEGPSTGISNDGRHERQEFRGLVSALSGTAPNQNFALTVRSGFVFNVVTTDATAIFNSNGSANPTLANGQSVEVHGIFNRALNALRARSVKIRAAGDTHGEAKVEGAPSNIGVTTFDVEATRVRGFVPRESVVHVTTTVTTRYFSNGGTSMTAAAFFAALVTAPSVEAEGTYSSTTNTLAAMKLKLDDEAGEHDAEANGQPTNINAVAGTFRVTLASWSGFSSTPGTTIDVRTTLSTTYRDNEGNPTSSTAFFTALASSPLVEVEGHYAAGVLTARKAKLDDD